MLDNGLQVHTIMASKFRCPSWHDFGLKACLFMATKSISKLARSRIPSLDNNALQVHISKLARLKPPSASPNSLNHTHQCITTMVSKCVTQLAPSRPPGVSPNLLDYGHHVGLNMASKSISKISQLRSQTVSLGSLH